MVLVIRGVAHVWIDEVKQVFSLPGNMNNVIQVIVDYDLFPREVMVELEDGQIIPFTEYASLIDSEMVE